MNNETLTSLKEFRDILSAQKLKLEDIIEELKSADKKIDDLFLGDKRDSN